MNEEVKIKIVQSMFEDGELERFDNNIHSIVEEYSKLMFKEKDQILTQRIIMKQEQEIERLTNDLEREKSQVKEYGTRLIKAIEYIEKQKPLNIDETRQKEQLKLAYKNSDIFKTLCHLEDLEIAIWELKDILKGVDKE